MGTESNIKLSLDAPLDMPQVFWVAGLMEHFLCITFSFSLNKSGIPVMPLWPLGVQGGSGKPAERSPWAQGELVKEGHQGDGGS